MEDIQKEKEVYFDDYCPICNFVNTSDIDEPCNTCLSNPSNINSHKPIKFKEKEK